MMYSIVPRRRKAARTLGLSKTRGCGSSSDLIEVFESTVQPSLAKSWSNAGKSWVFQIKILRDVCC